MLYGETRVIGAKGWTKLSEQLKAGEQSRTARRYTFKLNRGNSDKRWHVIADRPHPWPLTNGETTYDLRVGDVVKAVQKDQGYKAKAWLHGFLNRQDFSSGVFSLHKEKSIWHPRLRESALDVYRVESGIITYTFEDYPWQQFPYELDTSYDVDSAYIGSFVSGYVAAFPSDDNQISINDLTAAKWLYLHAPFGGYVGSGEITQTMKTRRAARITETSFHAVQNFQCVKGTEHGGFRVEAIETFKTEGLFYSASGDFKLVSIEGGIAAYL